MGLAGDPSSQPETSARSASVVSARTSHQPPAAVNVTLAWMTLPFAPSIGAC